MCEYGLPEQDEILNERLAHVVRVNSKDENGNSERTYKLTDGYSTIDKQHAIYTTKSADCYDSITELHNKKQVEDNGYDTVNSFLRCKNWEDESRKNRRRISSESDTCLNAKKEKKKLLRNSLKDLTPEKRKRISDIVKRSSQEGTLPGFISIWDFAGQYIYYATHQVFLATNAIYFLLFDMSKSLDENITITDCPDRQTQESGRTARSFIELWLQSIHAKKDGEIGELPPVILVGTHKDKIPCSPSEREEYINNYFESVRCLFDRSPLSNHIQPEQICLDNTVDESGVSELRNIIFEVAKRMPWWGKLKPAKWINLEQILMSMKEVKPLVRIQEIIEENNKSPLPLDTEDEIRAFLRTQHSSGDCLFFEESGLEETVVLRPQWIIDAFKSVVLSYEQLRRYCYLRPYLSDLSEKGILHKACIDQLWSENDYKTFAEHKETIILYMIKLCIIAKGNRSNSGEMFYFVPSLLPECKYGRDIDLQMAISENELSQDVRTDTPSLYIKVETSCYYPSLFHNIMSDCLSRWQTVRLNERYVLYSTGGLFSLDKSKCHLMSLKLDFLEKSAFYIICKIANVAKESVDTRKCDEVRRFLVSSVATHINLHDPGLLELLIQCTHPNKTHILGSLSSCELLDTYDSVGCHGHSSSFYKNVISSQQLLSFWFPNGYRKNDFSSLKQWVVEAPEYVNDKTLLDRDFEKLAMALGIGWEHVGISLGISSVEMDQCKLDYPQRTDMQVYAVLKKWKKKNKRKVTFLMFVKALFENETVNVDWDAVKNVGEDIYS